MNNLINAINLKTTFNTEVLNAVDQFMQLPDRKDSVKINVQDTNGIAIDLKTPKFEARPFAFKCVTIGATMDEYKSNYFGLFQLLKQQDTYQFYNDEVDMSIGIYFIKQTDLSGLYRTPERYYAQTFTLNFGETDAFSNLPIIELVDDGNNVLVP